MKRIIFTSVLTILSIFLFKSSFSQGYEIKVKIKGLKDTSLILGYHMDGKMLSNDTAQINHKGVAVFKGKERKHSGMYFIYLPSRNIINIFLGEDQEFSIETTNDNYYDELKISGSTENEAFYRYEQYLRKKGEEMKKYSTSLKDATDEEQKEEFREKMKKLNEEVEKEQNKYIAENQGSVFAKFVRATQAVHVPDAPENLKEEDKKNWQYYYYKNHFFDNYDLTDSCIVRTSILKAKLEEYYTRVLTPIPDSVIVDLDKLLKKTRSSKQVFKYFLGSLYNHYNDLQTKIMGMDAVFVYLADYYCNGIADWSSKKYNEKLCKHVEEVRPTLIGKTAFNFFVPRYENMLMRSVRLHSLPAKYTVLFFYEPDCGHCKKATPKMLKAYHNMKKLDVEVVGFYTQADTVKWRKFIEKHKLDWLNLWSPFDQVYRKYYNIKSTPSIFLLDQDKKIIAKRLAVEQIERIIINRILVEQIKDKNNDEKLTIFTRFMTSYTDTSALSPVKEVMLNFDIGEENNKKLKEKLEKKTKSIVISEKLYAETAGLEGKDLISKCESFINQYSSKIDIEIISEIVAKLKLSEKERKNMNKFLAKKLKSI